MVSFVYAGHKFAWATESRKTAQALFRCTELGNCAQNQTKVVIIPSDSFTGPVEGGDIGGEAIYAFSTLEALRNMGYSVFFAHNTEAATQLYHMFGALVKMVLIEGSQVKDCFESETYVRSPENPAGIPAWRIFSFFFWGFAAHPLGAKWTINPEDYTSDNTYVGYSIQKQCAKYPFVAHAQRSRKVYILAKFLKFFSPESCAWPPDFFDAAANTLGVSFTMGSFNLNSELSPEDLTRLASSIENVGLLGRDEFYGRLSNSVALVGLGDPRTSPTPYEALCFGVPFINPVVQWDPDHPTDRSKWYRLNEVSAPYVYHVFKSERDGFVNAIKDAIAHPIESYVLERMKISSVEYRLGQILEHDWRAEAVEVVKVKDRAHTEEWETCRRLISQASCDRIIL
ncbi:hypothetical protein DFH07DRAFT_735138 [Mycena maculata]|uniref:Glycosyltransferase family 18 catalytic domain-containing protein n=1 Tax=Mycena maculata TaxID=230809 RepID=A0AAD7JUQ9_9AGAR|nr:hypothetical protein DFH07DRAFT_735138 [Mycena maculata]